MDRPGRRRWTAEQKHQIVEETRAPGTSVSVVARRYDINANLLFKWKRHDETGRLVVPPPESPEFVPMGVVSEAGDDRPALLGRMPGIETSPPGERAKLDALIARHDALTAERGEEAYLRVGMLPFDS
jgi:transposase